jgi:NADH-quinone oxidoreductase subunit C/D
MQTAEDLVYSQVEENLYRQFGQDLFIAQYNVDKIPTLWVGRDCLVEVLQFLKPSFSMLYDLFAIDERTREYRQGQPDSDFTVVYQLLSMERNEDLRIKVALSESDLNIPSIISIWPNANWYEREAWDMFGVLFAGHPNLFRILLPPTWEGHALRKDHPARATEMGEFEMGPARVAREQEALRFRPEDWGMKAASDDSEFMFLNLGPNHPSVHGVFRIALQLDGEVIMDSVPDIGYHHRGAEKMAERQTWHTYIPYTDRIDYLGGVMNNLAYIQSVEMLAGVEVPERAKVIRIMLAELFRISSHLVFYGTFVQDVGQMSPVFYMFVDREKLFGIVEAITGGRMHPAWFRIGGVAQDLPDGWDRMIREFLDYLPARLDHYDKMAMQNEMLKDRTVGIGVYTKQEALDWGVTGPGLRATGSDWDVRKKRPYGGYDQFDFDVPTASNGDCYDRAAVRIEEMRQSLRIIRQCVDNMPSGPYKSDHSATTPPPKEQTMEDIETLIHHFLNVSWGPVIPEGEASVMIEATKGINSYHLISDRSTNSYRTRIRTPSFPHLQQIPLISKGLMIPDLIAIIASIDFVMADVDR